MTDVHLNFLDDTRVVEFARATKQFAEINGAESILITGDISESPTLFKHLTMLRDESGLSIRYVLGNHDYWKSGVKSLRDRIVSEFARDDILWLGNSAPINLTDETILIGADGWYDALNGDWTLARFIMNDWHQIEEYEGVMHMYDVNMGAVSRVSRDLATQSVSAIKDKLDVVIESGKKRVVLLTHFPPFVNASRYQGKQSDPAYVPWYTSKLMGDALKEVCGNNPDIDITVLCGHTHGKFRLDVAPNLRCFVGDAEYGSPSFELVTVR